MYTAELKRPITQSHSHKKAAVDELIDLLALDGCRNVLIGRWGLLLLYGLSACWAGPACSALFALPACLPACSCWSV